MYRFESRTFVFYVRKCLTPQLKRSERKENYVNIFFLRCTRVDNPPLVDWRELEGKNRLQIDRLSRSRKTIRTRFR